MNFIKNCQYYSQYLAVLILSDKTTVYNYTKYVYLKNLARFLLNYKTKNIR